MTHHGKPVIILESQKSSEKTHVQVETLIRTERFKVYYERSKSFKIKEVHRGRDWRRMGTKNKITNGIYNRNKCQQSPIKVNRNLRKLFTRGH